jgi:hypothetical protein
MDADRAAVDLAWAAGFFDGEGCFTAKSGWAHGHSYPQKYPRAEIAQKDPEVLLRFKAIVNCGKVYTYPPYWLWTTTAWAEAQWVLCQLYSFLSSVKQRQGIKMMEKFHETKNNRHGS